jgi:excisionase family DNA binding protein
MEKQPNIELLRAFLEPIIRDIVDERIESILKRKASENHVQNEVEKPIPARKLAEILGYSTNYIYELCKKENMPHKKRGRSYLFYLSKVNSWLERF